MKEKVLKNYTIAVYDPYLRPVICFSDYPGGEWVRTYSAYYRNLYKSRKVKVFKSDEEYNVARDEDFEQRGLSWIRRVI